MRYTLLLFALLIAVPAPRAQAAEGDRAALQRLFLEGRLRDMDVLVADDDPWTQFVLLVRNLYWRRGSTPTPALGEGTDLLTQRRNWVVRRAEGEMAPYPTGDGDPLPILTALIQDRELREGDSTKASRTDGKPIRDLTLDGQEAEARYFGLRFLTVHEQFEPREEDLASVARAESIASRNFWVGIGAVFLLLLASVLFGKRSAAQPRD